jgi:hypothetical protein
VPTLTPLTSLYPSTTSERPSVSADQLGVVGIDSSGESAAPVLDGLVTTADTFGAFAIGDPMTLAVDPDIVRLIDRDRDWQGVLPPIAPEGARVGTCCGVDIVI